MSAVLERVAAMQADHPVYPKFTAGELAAMPPDQALRLLEGRARMIAAEKADPFRHGYEPPFWDEVDWAVAERRAALPGVVLEVLILGGNRAAKTEYAAKRSVIGLANNDGWEACLLHLDEGASRAVQQARVWKYLPPEWKPESGKMKKTRVAKMNYNELTGFTENAFSLHNGARCRFKFYSADVTSVEGLEFDTAWSDELIPLNWMEAMEYRLLTRAARTEAFARELPPVLAAKAANPALRFPRELLGRLYQGVHLVTFTPIQGFTPTVARFLTGATTVKAVPAELLPVRGPDGSVIRHEEVPRVQRCKAENRLAVYFHTYDNPYGGNWKGMMARLANEPRRKIKERAYGVPEAAFDTRFPRFTRSVHVKPETFTPRDATWYHIVDPCPGRNFAMIWAAVNPLGEIFVAREWPQEDDYIPGVGNPGPWAVPGTGTRKDGDKGPAQQPFGFGFKTYKAEIARVERELYALLHPNEPPDRKRRIEVPFGNRIIDSRGGAAPSLSYDAPRTLIESFQETDPEDPDDEPVFFAPSSKSLTVEGGGNTITDGVELVNNLLWYPEEEEERRDRKPGLPAPRLFVCERCRNTIMALETWTGADGQKGAIKDFADLLRYLAQADPEYTPPGRFRPRGGGSF